MMPGPPLRKECPYCHEVKELLSLISGNTFNEPIKRHVQTVFAMYTHKNNLKHVQEPAYSIQVLGHVFKRHFVYVRLYGVELRPLRTEVYGKCLFVFKDLPTPPAKKTTHK